MLSTGLYQALAALLGALFVAYGMDIRRKAGARNFVAPAWQRLHKLSALVLIGGFAWLIAAMYRPDAIDWLALTLGAVGTGFVVAGKRTLGDAHTFAGQHKERPRLVTSGVYAVTRNPLYLGVFLSELWMLLVTLHQLPVLWPASYGYGLGPLGAALAYAVWFNAAMAIREASQLERCFGDAYRRYRSAVPFLIPSLRRRASEPAKVAAAPHVLQRRRFRLDPREEFSARGAWFGGRPLATQLLNAYTLLVPEGERFIIRTCRRYIDRADAGLREDLQRLFFQEGSHSREHGRLLAAMRREGLSLDRFRRLVDGFSYRMLEPLSPATLRLATAAALEHHNAVIAGFFLRRGLLQGECAGEVRRLFIWHFAEEIEHKEVVFRLLQLVSASRFLRTLGLAASWMTFLLYLGLGTLLLGVRTRAIFAAGFWRELLDHGAGRDGLLRELIRESWRYLGAGFHPRVDESRDLLDAALATLERG
jgi:predicted metal-dependent hydrolase/protein-S-isoprenylcysteine O-methyltransferase Ste14